MKRLAFHSCWALHVHYPVEYSCSMSTVGTALCAKCWGEARSKGTCPLPSWDLKYSRRNVPLYHPNRWSVMNCEECQEGIGVEGWLPIRRDSWINFSIQKSLIDGKIPFFENPGAGRSEAEFELWEGCMAGEKGKLESELRLLPRKVVGQMKNCWSSNYKDILGFEVRKMWFMIIFTFLEVYSS